jgi:N-acetylglucosamine-6-phosphate deacetylase
MSNPPPPPPDFALHNAPLWPGDGSLIESGFVVVRGGTITRVGEGPYRGGLAAIDLGGLALSPGMIDLMATGAFGKSMARDSLLDMANEYVRLGVTGCVFCHGMVGWEQQRLIADKLHDAARQFAGFLGIYLEGPFEHPDHVGSAMRDYALPPTPENVDRLLDLWGELAELINVSPGTDGDAAAVRRRRAAGKRVSMAHSAAPPERVLACVEAGTTVLGHCWNNHRGVMAEPGVQMATVDQIGLTDPRVRFVHMICDGVHVHEVLVRLVHRCRGVEGVCVVTDAIPQAGRPDGEYLHDDGRPMVKSGGVGRTKKEGWLAGSALLLPDQWRNFMRFTGEPPHRAIRTVTLNPAACVGREGRFGLLAAGHAADLVAWDSRCHATRVWHAGREVKDVLDWAEV